MASRVPQPPGELPFSFAKQGEAPKKKRGNPNKPVPLPVRMGVDSFDVVPPDTTPEIFRQRIDAKLNPLEWAYKYRKLHGRAFTLKRHKPLTQIYEDDHPHIVVIKPAQVGISEMTLTKTVWALDVGAKHWGIEKDGLNVGYIFPTEKALSDFSKERFAGLRTESTHLSEMFTAYDDVTFKQIRNSFLYMRGASSESSLLSFPADMLVLDEYDRITESARTLARQRLRASEVKREIDISTPTIPGVGIDALYAQSDQHVWQVQCQMCMEWSSLDFFTDLRVNDAPFDVWHEFDEADIRNAKITLHCPACHLPIDRCGEGRWIAQHPEREGLRGYHVPWYAFPNVDVTKLCLDAVSQDPTVRTEFYRSGLGLPFTEAGSRITREMLAALSQEIPHGLPKNAQWIKTTIGIDVGTYYHFRVSSEGPNKQRYVRAMGKAKSLADLDRIIRQYRVRKGIIDALPENHAVQEWVEKYHGRILRAFYSHGPRDPLYRLADKENDTGMLNGMWRVFSTKAKKPQHTITINRTQGMDLVYAIIAAGEEIWPREYTDDKDIIAQMGAPTRIEVKNEETGQYVAKWVHTIPDHSFHAAVYDRLAVEVVPKGSIQVLAQGAASGWNP